MLWFNFIPIRNGGINTVMGNLPKYAHIIGYAMMYFSAPYAMEELTWLWGIYQNRPN